MKKLIIITILFCGCAKKDSTQPASTTPPATQPPANTITSEFWGNYTLISDSGAIGGYKDSVYQTMHMDNPNNTFANNGRIVITNDHSPLIHNNIPFYLSSDTSATTNTISIINTYTWTIGTIPHPVIVKLIDGEVKISGKTLWMNLHIARFVDGSSSPQYEFTQKLTYKKP